MNITVEDGELYVCDSFGDMGFTKTQTRQIYKKLKKYFEKEEE